MGERARRQGKEIERAERNTRKLARRQGRAKPATLADEAISRWNKRRGVADETAAADPPPADPLLARNRAETDAVVRGLSAAPCQCEKCDDVEDRPRPRDRWSAF